MGRSPSPTFIATDRPTGLQLRLGVGGVGPINIPEHPRFLQGSRWLELVWPNRFKGVERGSLAPSLEHPRCTLHCTECTPHCTECTPPDGHRPTRQTDILESTGASGPDGRPGQISVIWGTEGPEFKSRQPDQ